MQKWQKGVALWQTLLIVLGVLIVGSGALWAYGYYARQKEQKNPTTTTTPANTNSTTTTETQWETYTNKEIGFSFEYPKNWTYEESTFPEVAEKNIKLSFKPVDFVVEVNASASLAVLSHAYDGYNKISSKTITIGGIKATERIWQTTPEGKSLYHDDYKAMDIVFSYKGNKYTLYMNYRLNEDEALSKNFEHIISSFQFVKQSAEEWLTYSNKEIGYTLKYPKGWKIEEKSEQSENEIGSGTLKYIKIYEPNKKYYLYFGLKKSNQDILITDRTGIGAGDMRQLTEKAVKVLEVSVVPEVLMFEGRVREYFYSQPSGTDKTCNCQFTATISPATGEFFETTSPDVLDIPNQILASVKWL